MQSQNSNGPFCQSCGMPLQNPEDFGTAANESRVNDYCHFCFQKGSFTEPNINMQDMIGKCVSIMAGQGIMPEPQAKALMTDLIPKLKRWQKK
jgi:hypothetical protein